MRVLMTPFQPKKIASGIDNVVAHYHRHLPEFGVEVVDENEPADLWAIHIYAEIEQLKAATIPIVVHNHGLHWTGDYPCDRWQWYINALAIQTIRHAREVTVPSDWVAETFQRDMRFSPHVIPHGINWREWEPQDHQSYVLWNKNRIGDVCHVEPVLRLAHQFSDTHFVTTFAGQGTKSRNVQEIGTQPHDKMKDLVQAAMVYLSTTKETFGIGTLEAMASGVPVLGWRYGGNIGLVQHGVNGYLATPNDYDDLARGLRYCVEHRGTLGANGREMSKAWTWERACEMVAGVYRLALEPSPEYASVVIPFYNKTAEQLRRAAESALAQDYDRLQEVIVVDDGSTDPEVARRVVSSINSDKLRLYRKPNGGVATARNYGIEEASGEYVACLDADDAMGRSFVSACITELRADPSLGIAYSAIDAIAHSGRSISKWPPDEPVYDDQFAGRNQIPTCCVFKREMWQRLGGYRQRYAHSELGAGAEDAEFWLRAMAAGYGAKMVGETAKAIQVYHTAATQIGRPPTDDEMGRQFTPEYWQGVKDSLFIYSLGGGLTSQSGYSETDWLPWHPWNNRYGDDRHPIASTATPASKMSHPVRQYDEPVISVIIPVGPGHEEAVINALDSLEAQTFRKWEAIVVWDNWGTPDDDKIHVEFYERKILESYPYIKSIKTGRGAGQRSLGSRGAGVARNLGASVARGEFLVFLDADDWLHRDCLEAMLDGWADDQGIIYTDYINRAIINTEYLNQLKRAGLWLETMKTLDDGRHLAAYTSKAKDYDCGLAQIQPRLDGSGQLYTWCLVTSLIPKAWHNAIGGFDESMVSFEDVDYHWRLARAGYCYTRVAEQLVIYNYHLGHRRESGLQNHESLIQYIQEKYKEVPAMGCPSCGGKNRRVATRTPARAPARQVLNRPAASQNVGVATNDAEWLMCIYSPQKGGKHQVTGQAQFDARLQLPNGGNVPMVVVSRQPFRAKIDYGYRQQGNQILVHRADVELAPLVFQPIKERVVRIKPDPAPPPPPPEPIVRADLDSNTITKTGEELIAPVLIEADPDLSPPPQILGGIADIAETEEAPEPSLYTQLQKIPGVSDHIAAGLIEAGVVDLEDIVQLGESGLKKMPGVGPARAKAIASFAQQRLTDRAQAERASKDESTIDTEA